MDGFLRTLHNLFNFKMLMETIQFIIMFYCTIIFSSQFTA